MIAVTGASGFVGKALCDQLECHGFAVRRLVRSLSGFHPNEIEVGDINADTDWSSALSGASTIVHCAARTHVMNDLSANPLASYRSINVNGTRRLAKEATRLGVKRLVFLSSIKVNGERTTLMRRAFDPNGIELMPSIDIPFTSFDAPFPQDDYGITKLEAELELWRESLKSSLEVVVIRAPLVYGPGVRANFLRLIRLVQREWPLPLSLLNNRRSLVALDNLIDLLILCTMHPNAAGQVFLVSDGEDLSTPELIRRLARIMDVSVRLFPVPPSMLNFAGRLIGRHEEVDRLIGTLQVDISHTCKMLGWSPLISVDEGLRRTIMGL